MRSEQLNDEIESRYGNPATFVSQCKRALWDNDISQADLAREAGYDAGNVNRWLNGRQTPSLKVMVILDEALERLLEDK
jgi:transcriptional regulator with XRE-family HTH domain